MYRNHSRETEPTGTVQYLMGILILCGIVLFFSRSSPLYGIGTSRIEMCGVLS